MTELSGRAPLPLLNTDSSCACCAPATSARAAEKSPAAADGVAAVTTVLQVSGMTCGHCVTSVTEELSAVQGVTGVDVDLVAGGTSAVSVTSAGPLDAAAALAAVEEAGYSLVPSGR